MNDNQEKTITLYPSNWLYNAGVVGFLRVLEFGNAGNMSEFIKDGDVKIDRQYIQESYKFIFKYHKQKMNEDFAIWGKNKRYPNYIQPAQKVFFEKHYIKSLQNVASNHSGKNCNWCEGYFLPNESLEKLKEEWISMKGQRQKGKAKSRQEEEGFNRFIEQREKFQGIHIKELGGAITEMPNAFWNLNFSTPICHLCSYLIIFHHLAFFSLGKNYEIFINTPHFGLTWDLNKFVGDFLSKPIQYEIRKLLGSSLLQWAIKKKTLLGAWTMMNIEMIIKKWHREEKKWIIDYFDLPYYITRILLDPEIASLINTIGEEKIFDLIVSGKFSELEKANYFVLRSLLKLKNNERISESDPITKYADNYRDKNHLIKVSNLLPELYAKITKILKTEVKYEWEIY
ncbi:MAG: hypothetical protein ABIL44_07995 [candidate division WOR-3 bacterium]